MDPSALSFPRQTGSEGRLLTEHSEDGRRGGPAGAVATLGPAVVRASIGAGGCREQEAAAGTFEKQGSVQVPGEAGVRRQAQATPAAQCHRLPFCHLRCWADEETGRWQKREKGGLSSLHICSSLPQPPFPT